jgi:selenocysteine lyase/cysteine desulfurase
MQPGDEILLTFDDFDSIASPWQARVFARGYYVPLQEPIP